MAKKYGLLTSGCGYPKEVKLVRKIEEVFGRDVCSKILFEKERRNKKEIIREELGEKEANLFDDIYFCANRTFRDYINKPYNGLDGPMKKAQTYSNIDYGEAYSLIENYKKETENSVGQNNK